MDVVSVLREDPDLGQALDPLQADAAARHALARVVSLPKGELCPGETVSSDRGTFGLLVLDGLLLRGVAVDARPSVEVLGAGDVIRDTGGEWDPDALVQAEVRWWALRPARLAVLDAGFIHRMAVYPGVISELGGRLAGLTAANALRLSVVQQPNLSRRLHFMLWHLADRFGRVRPGGVVLPLPLCHTLLAWLVGAGRPAVSRALKELERAGQVRRRPDGTWSLASTPVQSSRERSPAPQHIAA